MVATSPWLALVLLVLMLVGWVAVQTAWRRSFPDASGERDALAGRGGCGGCRGGNCTNSCDGEGAERPHAVGRQAR